LVSGGRRCNVTNGCTSVPELIKAYPRGGSALKKLLPVFGTQHTIQWFEKRGVPMVVQPDNCVFPVSQNAQSIVDCFLQQCRKLGVEIKTNCGVKAIKLAESGLVLHFEHDKNTPEYFDKVIVTTGGSPKMDGLKWLKDLGHSIEMPVPSLFTFNMPAEPVRELMGVVVDPCIVSIQGTKFKATGPLLITHWGMSGPAVLKLSAFGARLLSEKQYNFSIQVNWANESNFDIVFNVLEQISIAHSQKLVVNMSPFGLSSRLWQFLVEKCEIPATKKWNELGKKGLNKLVNILCNDEYKVSGKTTFRDEFVTCGGVSLQSVDVKTMQSKVVSGLYFAGEVLDIDGITGGYNLQNAWTTGFIAGMLG